MTAIRWAEERDLEQIIVLCQEHANYEKADYEIEDQYERLSGHLFGESPSLKCLVVETDGAMVGYATFMKQFSTWEASHYLYLDCLYLREAARGKGWGVEVMEKVREYATAENCQVVQWQTPAFNKAAIHFYQKIGGHATTKERFFWHLQS